MHLHNNRAIIVQFIIYTVHNSGSPVTTTLSHSEVRENEREGATREAARLQYSLLLILLLIHSIVTGEQRKGKRCYYCVCRDQVCFLLISTGSEIGCFLFVWSIKSLLLILTTLVSAPTVWIHTVVHGCHRKTEWGSDYMHVCWLYQ